MSISFTLGSVAVFLELAFIWPTVSLGGKLEFWPWAGGLHLSAAIFELDFIVEKVQ